MEKIARHGPDVFYTGEIGMYTTYLSHPARHC